MWKSFCRWLLYKQLGWSIDITQEHPSKYIICLAPHTSNWDFLIGQLYNGAEGLKSNFLMKKEWFFWPLGPIFRSLGGIPVFRSKKTSMTDNLAEAARKAEKSLAESRMEERFLLYCPKGRDSHSALWR